MDVSAAVLSNVRLSDDYNVLTMAAPEIGELAAPGQFVMVKSSRSPEPLLRRPFSIFEVVRDAAGRTVGISILNKRIGRTTGLLFETSEHDFVQCLGPLGKPFTPVSAPTRAWMVAGGVGLAPFVTLAATLASRGTRSTLFYGARTSAELFSLERFERLGVGLVLATEDGSRGTHARVTGPLQRELAGLTAAGEAMVYACGPEPMLAAVAHLATRYLQPSEVSVERVMGCGLGGCYSCVIPLHQGGAGARFVRSCITGPVFDGAQVAWG